MSWSIDKQEKFMTDVPLCEDCVHRTTCNDLALLVALIDTSKEVYNEKGKLAVVGCSGFESERAKWP